MSEQRGYLLPTDSRYLKCISLAYPGACLLSVSAALHFIPLSLYRSYLVFFKLIASSLSLGYLLLGDCHVLSQPHRSR
ncbi:hypothetical protein V8F20_000185 [Naviculisporaceae sp. PSN 640]